MSDIRRPMTEIRDRGRGRDRVVACSLLALAATVAYPNVSARQMPSAPAYAITGAKIVTGTSTIDKGTIVMRNGIITFPGGVALYKSGHLVGGVGVSGDGVDQDEAVAFAGAAGFLPGAGVAKLGYP